ncbi:zinc finger, BED-type [Artemisia annua]|uniref:Zinc finger, BED-type n=1 Tax=Artemisia annua TaxID=35608 RepID=A0A2U1MNL9_ARTAN|nr:zinc finger, BED-type [Artemisia annua]
MHASDDLEVVSSSTTSNLFSRVWEYFTLIPIEPDRVKRASCNSCNKVLKVHGTSNIRRHIVKCFKVDLSNKVEEDAPPPKRICLDQAKYKEKVAISIIKHNYPFSYVEHEGTNLIIGKSYELHPFVRIGIIFVLPCVFVPDCVIAFGFCCISRVCRNSHGLIRKYGLMCFRQCFHSNAKEIGFIKYH